MIEHDTPPLERDQPGDNESNGSEKIDETTSTVDEALPIDDEESPLPPSYKDIGSFAAAADMRNDLDGMVLQSQKQAALRKIKDEIGSRQVTIGSLEFAPDWVLDDAIHSELATNWKGAYTAVSMVAIPQGANLISSHLLFKVKDDDKGNLKLKARLVLHGHRDRDRYSVRRDSASADLSVVRLLISLASILNFSLATADVQGAYMQSGPIQRDIYVRPPRRIDHRQSTAWKLLRLPYGIVEAGRQWLCAIEDWLTRKYNMNRVLGVEQLFYKKGEDGKINILVAKVVDDFLIAGTTEAIDSFLEALGQHVKIGHIGRSDKLKFLGCCVTQSPSGDIELSMSEYMGRIKPLELSKSRRGETSDKATPAETHLYRSLAGTLLYLGQAVIPQANLIASKMQQRLGSLHVSHIIEANAMVRELLRLKPAIMFLKAKNIKSVAITTFSDASHAGVTEVYGQSGILSGLQILMPDKTLFHPIAWSSHKQKRISYSSYGAEILAAADADDRGFHLKQTLHALFPDVDLKHQLLVDSKSLFETITTLHQPGDYRLRKVVARMRDSFESKELNIVRWIPGNQNYGDALTKRNIPLSQKLNTMLASGEWNLNMSHSCQLDSDTWN